MGRCGGVRRRLAQGSEGGATLLEMLRGKRVCQERTWTALFISHAFPSQLRRWAAEAAGGEQLPEARSHLTNRPERAPEYSVYPSCSGTEGSAVSLGNAALQAAGNHLVRGSARPARGSLALGPPSRDACEGGAGTGHSGSRWTGLGGDHGWVGRMQKLRPQVTLPLLPGGGRPSSDSDR